MVSGKQNGNFHSKIICRIGCYVHLKIKQLIMNHLKTIFRISIGIMLLTILHHFYGSLIYHDDFRLHVVFVAVPLILLIILCYNKMKSASNVRIRNRYVWAFLITVIVTALSGIGLFEGVYNHILKNIVYFLAHEELFLSLFPPSVYEVPGDVIFEFTGMLQGVLGILLGGYLIRFFRGRMNANMEKSIQ